MPSVLAIAMTVVVVVMMAVRPTSSDGAFLSGGRILYQADSPDVDYYFINRGYMGSGLTYPLRSFSSPGLLYPPSTPVIGSPVYLRQRRILSAPFMPGLYK